MRACVCVPAAGALAWKKLMREFWGPLEQAMSAAQAVSTTQVTGHPGMTVSEQLACSVLRFCAFVPVAQSQPFSTTLHVDACSPQHRTTAAVFSLNKPVLLPTDVTAGVLLVPCVSCRCLISCSSSWTT